MLTNFLEYTRILSSKNYLVGVMRFLAAVFLCAPLLLAGGCTSFDHDWEKAARQSAPADDIQGRWLGVWLSEVNGHNGELRCVVTKKENGAYKARFHARYNKVLSFGYTVPLKVEPSAGEFKFSGDANLGWLKGGVYHYDGHANMTNFFSTYSCKYDHGTFQMARPKDSTGR